MSSIEPSSDGVVMMDPVCGMHVGSDALRAEGYDDIGFCSEVCLGTFLEATAEFGRWIPRRTVNDPCSG